MTLCTTSPPSSLTKCRTLAKEYVQCTQKELPLEVLRDMSTATMWSELAARLVKTAHQTDLGRKLLLEDEGAQILQDTESVWLVLLVEAFDLEKVLEDDTFELVAFPQDLSTILSSSRQLALCMTLSSAHTIRATAPSRSPGPAVHRIAFVPESDPPMPLYQHMPMWALHTDVDVLRRLETLLTNSALFVTFLAWSSGSALTEPNAIAFRAIVKVVLCSEDQ
ncbi:hypothetical protein EXIGLDRAFT_779341 [Exidia glandulosa HHB12029]|uniref:Uncharacterized protein n=1 Tax=Exidia glandulosa HHB12029 TaxID=1314781 RepID=A0A165C4E8_EXIGL|nr:hypothetical protein EXIGLDRAFT_779341 [Exidia glandulosa HHB12029]